MILYLLKCFLEICFLGVLPACFNNQDDQGSDNEANKWVHRKII